MEIAAPLTRRTFLRALALRLAERRRSARRVPRARRAPDRHRGRGARPPGQQEQGAGRRRAALPPGSRERALAFALEARGVPRAPREARIRDALDLVGLSGLARRPPGELS